MPVLVKTLIIFIAVSGLPIDQADLDPMGWASEDQCVLLVLGRYDLIHK